MTTVADLQAARSEFAAWQRTDEEAAHDRDPRRVRVMRIVAAERVRLIEQLLAIGGPAFQPQPVAREARHCHEDALQAA